MINRTSTMLMTVEATRLPTNSAWLEEAVAQQWRSGLKGFQTSDTRVQGNQAMMAKARHQRAMKTFPKTQARYCHVPRLKIRRNWKRSDILTKASVSVMVLFLL